MRGTPELAVGLVALAVTIASVAASAAEAGTEQLCVKSHSEPMQGLAIACYSNEGCAWVEGAGGDPVRDYDVKSVPYALGRGKIEGIVTADQAIMRHIAKYGYSCRPLTR
jgi:hypothetical protein